MNSLSWFLYMAEVIPNIGNAAVVYFVLVGFFGSIGVIFLAMETNANTSKLIKWHIAGLVIALFIAVATPSKETIYLIAGSQAGAAVVASEDGQDIINDIRLIIKGQLADMVPHDLGDRQ